MTMALKQKWIWPITTLIILLLRIRIHGVHQLKQTLRIVYTQWPNQIISEGGTKRSYRILNVTCALYQRTLFFLFFFVKITCRFRSKGVDCASLINDVRQPKIYTKHWILWNALHSYVAYGLLSRNKFGNFASSHLHINLGICFVADDALETIQFKWLCY